MQFIIVLFNNVLANLEKRARSALPRRRGGYELPWQQRAPRHLPLARRWGIKKSLSCVLRHHRALVWALRAVLEGPGPATVAPPARNYFFFQPLLHRIEPARL